MKNENIDVTVVIPTYNEAKSIGELIERLAKSFKESSALLEIIVVDDDSPDDTAGVAKKLCDIYNLKVIVRKNRRGLATAVADGWKKANGKYLAVIDGDLQHPPDITYKLYQATQQRSADMAVASRKVEGGGTCNWEYHRMVISSTATFIAKLFLPFTLYGIRDATTGAFLFDREKLDISKLSPVGFKIFLETLVKGKFKNPVEVPYIFNQRSLGESKMSASQNIIFLIHLLRLGFYTGEAVIPITVLFGFAYCLQRFLF